MTDAKEYGRALFLLAQESGTADTILCDCADVAQVIKENPDYIKLLDTPALSKEEKLSLIDEAFSSVDVMLKNLLKILTERRLAHLFTAAVKGYREAYDEAYGIERVEAISAVPLSEEQTLRIKAKLETITGKKIIIKNTIDTGILGGIKLRYSGKQLDGSVRTRLDGFSKNLKNILI